MNGSQATFLLLGNPAKRLLFVDDEPSIRATLPVILGRRGFQVSVAATVSEALHFIRIGKFDLLLCDLNIETGEDGYLVVEAFKQANANCVAAILTGFPPLNSAMKAIQHGVDEYFPKPIRADALIAALTQKLAELGS